jgi:hypothetical protein
MTQNAHDAKSLHTYVVELPDRKQVRNGDSRQRPNKLNEGTPRFQCNVLFTHPIHCGMMMDIKRAGIPARFFAAGLTKG